MADLLDTHLGNYRLVRLLGKGGFASVYLGEHRYLNTLAAIKVMEAYLAGEQVAQFQQEARTIAHLVHPHIVRVLEFGVDAGTPFLVMDYAPAGTLRTRHPRGSRIALAQILAYVQQIASALDYAHQQRLIHRDIKPENILLGRADHLWLSDFGLAIVAHSSTSLHMAQTAGTVIYMAPEQFEGKPRPASDQYALAVMVYEWLTGTPPFSGTTMEVAMQHMASAPPPLAGVPPGVQAVLLTALAKDPGQRFPTAQAFADALQQAGTPATVMTAPSASPAEAAQADPQPEPAAVVLPAPAPLSQFPTRHLKPADSTPPTDPAPRRLRPPSRRWLLISALLVILLVSGIALAPSVRFLGTGGVFSGAAAPPATVDNTPARPTVRPGQTNTPGSVSTAGTAGTPGTAASTPRTPGSASPTPAGNASPTPPLATPTATPTTPPAALVASPLSLSFSLTLVACLVKAPSKSLTLTNQGGLPANWQTTIENPAYLSVTPASGSLAAGQSTQLTVTVICPSISLNTVDHITIQWGSALITITVTLSIL